jgi:zinc and cadmium transporter
MNIWIYTLISVIIISLVSLVGVISLSIGKERLRKATIFLVSFAVGALFGDAIVHLIPESFEKIGSNLTVSLLILLGIISFFILEKFIHWRHCHVLGSEKHLHPFVFMNIFGDLVHNFIDGMLIAGSFLVSVPLGVTTSIAVILHEIPQEIGDFAVLIHGGLTVRKALAFNFLSATSAIVGAVLILLVGSHLQERVLFLLPITAGGFLYIAGSDLIPELKHETKIAASIGQLAAIILGIAIMASLLLVG